MEDDRRRQGGQLSWDDTLEPLASHDVTSIVAGNCGLGYSPVRSGERGPGQSARAGHIPDGATQSIAALAAAAGQDPQTFLYDDMLRDLGPQFAVLYVANFNGSSYVALQGMIEHAPTVLGLGVWSQHVMVGFDDKGIRL